MSMDDGKDIKNDEHAMSHKQHPGIPWNFF